MRVWDHPTMWCKWLPSAMHGAGCGSSRGSPALWQNTGEPGGSAQSCCAHLCLLCLLSLADFLPQPEVDKPHRLAPGFRFEQINELQGKLQKQHNLQSHKVLKEKSATKRTPGTRKGKKFLLLHTELCKAQNTLTWAAVCHALTQTCFE